jgi:hypothetical protein
MRNQSKSGNKTQETSRSENCCEASCVPGHNISNGRSMARNQNPVRQEKEEERLKVYKKEKQIDRVVATAFQGRCNCFAPFANKGKCPCWNQSKPVN